MPAALIGARDAGVGSTSIDALAAAAWSGWEGGSGELGVYSTEAGTDAATERSIKAGAGGPEALEDAAVEPGAAEGCEAAPDGGGADARCSRTVKGSRSCLIASIVRN